ncbi:MAG TPA: hypothetical protein VMB05_11410 [Solirubrobacteraceae bacterium]|nr:hypothetical protein [Solirubrobacteraceae bacterium]
MSGQGENHYDALARTTLLIDEEWFGGEADCAAIADALLASTVRITADTDSLSTRAGQTTLITAFMLIARMGIGIELAIANVDVIDCVAPLRCGSLLDALIDLGRDLVPGARVRTHVGEVQDTIAIGASPGETSAVRVWADETSAVLRRGGVARACAGELPFGGFAAGAAAAPIALEAVRARIEASVGLPARRRRPSPGPPVEIRLAELFPGIAEIGLVDLGKIDAISGGAITHAAVYCLLRVPGLSARMRVIERQATDLSNVNRYSLLRRSDGEIDKVTLLAAAAGGHLAISGVRDLFTRASRGALLPLAKRVLVGVDDVEARWWVAEAQPAWLAVGATGNNLAQLTVHEVGRPCAACAHPEPVSIDPVPTISFVSFWAGLLQACALLGGVGGASNMTILPFALGDATPLIAVPPVANPACPIGCAAARRLRY